jgi:hypothetical protein
MKTEVEVKRALEIILVAARSHMESGNDEELGKLAGTSLALAWMLDDGSEPGKMFQGMIDQCDALDLSRSKTRRHIHKERH